MVDAKSINPEIPLADRRSQGYGLPHHRRKLGGDSRIVKGVGPLELWHGVRLNVQTGSLSPSVAQSNKAGAFVPWYQTFGFCIDDPGWTIWPYLHRVFALCAVRGHILLQPVVDDAQVNPFGVQEAGDTGMVLYRILSNQAKFGTTAEILDGFCQSENAWARTMNADVLRCLRGAESLTWFLAKLLEPLNNGFVPFAIGT